MKLPTTSTYLGLGLLAACWRQAAALYQRVQSLFVCKVTITGHAPTALNHYWNTTPPPPHDP